MKPSFIIFTAWIVFGGSHLLISGTAVRPWLVNKFGPRAFTLIFAGITTVTLVPLIASVAIYADQGTGGLNLAANPIVNPVLFAVGAIGAFLTFAGLFNYPKSAIAFLSQRQRSS